VQAAGHAGAAVAETVEYYAKGRHHIAGNDLSHPASVTRPSKRRVTITSIESAMTSRLTHEARMPSCPMATTSDIAMVRTQAAPPATRMAFFAGGGQIPQRHVDGVTSFHELAIASAAGSNLLSKAVAGALPGLALHRCHA